MVNIYIYICEEDRVLYRLTFHLKHNQSVSCQCNTPFLTQGSEEQKCKKRASVPPTKIIYLYLYIHRYGMVNIYIYVCVKRTEYFVD